MLRILLNNLLQLPLPESPSSLRLLSIPLAYETIVCIFLIGSWHFILLVFDLIDEFLELFL